MMNMQTYYVVFMGRRHGVYDFWVECQNNVLIYTGSVYKSYTFKEEAVWAWVFYRLRWKRSDECSSTGKPKSEHAIDDHHSLENISYTYVISFFVGFFVASVLPLINFYVSSSMDPLSFFPHLFFHFHHRIIRWLNILYFFNLIALLILEKLYLSILIWLEGRQIYPSIALQLKYKNNN